jgi:hypothetical protein
MDFWSHKIGMQAKDYCVDNLKVLLRLRSSNFNPKEVSVKFFNLLFVLLIPNICAAAPDLYTTLRVTGPGILNKATGKYSVPVRVSVRNSGNDIAGRFKIGIEFSHTSFAGLRLIPFTNVVSSDRAFSGDGFYVWTERAIFPGAAYTFTAMALIPSSVPRAASIKLRASSDVCFGEEFMPYFCRLEESNEDNNRTDLQNATLPK